MRSTVPIIALTVILPLAVARIVFLEPRPDLEYEGVVFRPDDTRAGIIQAFDAETDELLWEKRVYDYFKDPLDEPDVVWRYVSNFFLDRVRKRLIVYNDNDTLTALDLVSKEVVLIERARGVTTEIQTRREGDKEITELLVKEGDTILKRFPSLPSERWPRGTDCPI